MSQRYALRHVSSASARLQRKRGPRARVSVQALATEPSEIATGPLQKHHLVEYIASGCKPRSKWRIGTEHEKFAYRLNDKTRADYGDIEKVLQRLVSRFGWSPMMEAGKIIGCKKDGQSVTLEPGGQFELSGAPLANLHQTCDEVNSHLYQAKTISEELSVGFMGMGFDPSSTYEEVPMMPKARYNIMRTYMPKVNLDYESEQDMIEKFRIGLALQPITTALFASSPFKEGKLSGYNSWRGNVWTDVDNNRCGNLPFVFSDDFSFEKYVEWALDAPMYFVYRDGEYFDATGLSFRDFMEGKLSLCPGMFGPVGSDGTRYNNEGGQGELATIDDWEQHLSTVFPDVRMKKFLEMRGADGGPWKMICAMPALWVGLLYNAKAQKEALELISEWTVEEMTELRNEIPKHGLTTPFRGGTALDVAKQIIDISRGGLDRRGLDETGFLRKLDAIVESGENQADQLVRLYETEWDKSVDPVFEYMAF